MFILLIAMILIPMVVTLVLIIIKPFLFLVPYEISVIMKKKKKKKRTFGNTFLEKKHFQIEKSNQLFHNYNYE